MLLHLNLAGKRLGDESVMLLAPALATIRHVDLRYNNIGDNGAIAIAGAVRAAAIIAARKVKVGSGGRMKSDTTRGTQIVSSIFVPESLSLAGNRIGDAGCDALQRDLLHNGVTDDGRNNSSSAATFTVRWLSVSGNPRISVSSRRRLLQAGARCHPIPVIVVT